jgi:hypothetical protein
LKGPRSSVWQETVRFWLGPCDPIRLETFRVCFGLTLLVYMAAWWRFSEFWLTPADFHVSSAGAGPYGPAAPLLPRSALPVFGTLLFGAIGAFVAGVLLRWVTWLLLGLITYVTYADPVAAFTLNRLYIAGLALLAVVPKGAYWSITPSSRTTQSVWPVRVLQATLLIQYFTAGWCKLTHGDWLADPYVLWEQAQGWYMTDTASWLLHSLPRWAFAVMQYGAFAFELGAPVLFGWKRLRPLAYVWGFVFQFGTALIAGNLIYFSLQMVSFYVLFIDDARLHRVREATARALAPISRRLAWRSSRRTRGPDLGPAPA